MNMRKRYRVLVLAALAAAVAVPLTFGLSLESKPAVVTVPHAGNVAIVAASAKSYSLFLPEQARPRSSMPQLPDGAKLLFVGSALFGLAGVMRKNH